MKKFLSVFFAIFFALSVTSVAFASEENLTCDTCYAKLETKEAYSKHINGGCLVDFKSCQYCGARVAEADLANHEASCPKGACTCKYCGKDFETKGAHDEHIDACKAEYNNIPVDEVKDKVVDTVKGIDWGSLLGKIVDAVKGLIGSIDLGGLIAKIKPLFEKVIELIKGAAAK